MGKEKGGGDHTIGNRERVGERKGMNEEGKEMGEGEAERGRGRKEEK